MQEKDLHKLGKTDLLTVIYKQEKQIQQLTKDEYLRSIKEVNKPSQECAEING